MNKILIYGILFVAIGYFFRVIYLKISADNIRATNIRLREEELNSALQERDLCRTRCLDKIALYYGLEKARVLADGGIWVGMPSYLLLFELGPPADEKEAVRSGHMISKFYYGAFPNRLGNIKHSLEVTVDNNIVVGWKQLA
jgi:hypothetical protein